MKTISLALYAEGTTDYRFLPIIIQQTVEKILFDNSSPNIGVVEPTLITGIKGRSDKEKLLLAAGQASGAHILFVHFDADSRTINQVKTERFLPGLESIIIQSQEEICKNLVPVIPVKNLEAWLVCDYEAFQKAVGTSATPTQLGLPSHPRLTESLPLPKHTFNEALRIAHSLRRKRTRYAPGEYYELIARTISLDNLLKVPAFIAFYNELTDLLKNLKFIN